MPVGSSKRCGAGWTRRLGAVGPGPLIAFTATNAPCAPRPRPHQRALRSPPALVRANDVGGLSRARISTSRELRRRQEQLLLNARPPGACGTLIGPVREESPGAGVVQLGLPDPVQTGLER